MRAIVTTTFAAILLSACASSNSLKMTDAGSAVTDFSRYDTIYVQAFEDETPGNKLPNGFASRFNGYVTVALRNTDTFTTVVRDVPKTPAPNSLILTGDVTGYEKGDAALRTFVGYGAGNTYLEALLTLRDAASGETLGKIVVDKDSGFSGGILAADKSPERYVRSAAKKIAKEVAKVKD
jgi:hypothetical protein